MDFSTILKNLIEGVNDNKLEIYLYHIPQVCGVGLSIDLVKKLKSSFPETIIGIKDSSGVWDNTEALLGIKGLNSLSRSRTACD